MTMLIKIGIYSLLALSLAAPKMVRAGYEEGYQAANKGAYAVAFKEFRVAAENGDARAQYSLAVMYNDGIGVRKSPDEALVWFRKAAAQGHPLAREILKSKQNDVHK
jgi:TPR repeat protein